MPGTTRSVTRFRPLISCLIAQHVKHITLGTVETPAAENQARRSEKLATRWSVKDSPAGSGEDPRNRMIAGRNRNSGSVRLRSQLVMVEGSVPSWPATLRCSRPRSSLRFRR